ncbi:MAG: T9SS type A sorting domain-containing protein [Bacteroidia bacterium]
MKKLLFFFLIILGCRSFATHNRAGEILYKRIAPFSTGTGTNAVAVYNYSFTIIKYTDHGSGVADRCADTIYFGDGQKGIANRINGGTALCGDCSQCGDIIVNNPPYIVKRNIYTVTHTYLSAGTFTAYSNDPNRNGGIINIPNSVNVPFYIESLIVIPADISPNSSPILSNAPTDLGSFSTCYYHNPGAYDPDGDSLSYEIVTCNYAPGQAIAGYTFPSPGFGIDQTNGTISWCTAQAQGEYNIAFLVKEWRKPNCGATYNLIGYVRREMQVLIGSSPSQTISFSSSVDTCIIAGTNYSRSIAINCNNSTKLELLGATANTAYLPQASLSTTIIPGNSSVLFNWNTNCQHIRKETYQCVISADPSVAKEQRKYFIMNLKVVLPSPVITNIVTSTNHVILTWKKIANCGSLIKGYNIYRKNGTNSWAHSPCETGVPAYSGFNLIGSNIPTDTVYNDGLFNPVTNGSLGNYIVTAVMDDCAESFADTIKIVSFIIGLKENRLMDSDISIFPNPFLKTLQVDLHNSTFEKVESVLYCVDGKIILTQLNNNCNEIFTLKTTDLKPGIYFLHLRTEKGTLVKKVIKE